MENGDYKVSLEALFKILSIFQMNIAEFFHEEAPPSISEREIDFLRDYQKLDPAGQREVWDFLRFKRLDVDEEESGEESAIGERHPERDRRKE